MPEKPLYYEMQRCLTILRQLQRAPATKAALMEYVRVEVAPEAYPDDPKLADKTFARDIDRLRDWGVEIVTGKGHEYHLQSYGAFNPVSLDAQGSGRVGFFERDLCRGRAAGRGGAAASAPGAGLAAGGTAQHGDAQPAAAARGSTPP
jgi:hypothetical protein